MTEAKEREGIVPSWLVTASYPAGVVAMTLFFVYLGFPYDLLVTRWVEPLETSTSVRVRIGDAGPHVSLLGPGIEVLDIMASPAGGRPIVVDRLFVRPAWSLSWFTLDPAVHLDVASDVGAGEGTVTLGHVGAWQGELVGVQLGALPVASMLANLDLDGTLDATFDLHGREEESGGGLVGLVHFDLRDGSVAGQGFPIALPFETLAGDLRFGDQDALVRTDNVSLEGPVLAATIAGQIGKSSVPGQQPLDVTIQYELHDETLAAMFGTGGTGRVAIGGTLQSPIVR